MLVPFTIPLIATVVGLPFVGARSLATNQDVRQIRASSTGLFARQGTGPFSVPTECTSICDPIKDELTNGCTSAAQCCTSTFETQYFNCALCTGKALQITDYSAPQALLDDLRQKCASSGIAIPAFTFPGEGPSGSPSATGLPSSSSRSSSGIVSNSGSGTSTASTTSGFSTLSVPLPPITQQTITTLSSTNFGAGTDTNAAPTPSSNSGSGEYSVSHLVAVVASLFVAAWHLG